MKSFMASPETIERKWYVVDATGHTLGRLSSEIASILRGKNKPTFTPHIDTGDYVIVVNAEKIKVTGNKLNDKIYYHHSDYVGGMKEQTLKEKMDKKPEEFLILGNGELSSIPSHRIHRYEHVAKLLLLSGERRELLSIEDAECKDICRFILLPVVPVKGLYLIIGDEVDGELPILPQIAKYPVEASRYILAFGHAMLIFNKVHISPSRIRFSGGRVPSGRG